MSPTGGRWPAPRGVFAIEDQLLVLPDPIALDTSFVVEALLTTQPLHAACDAFLTRDRRKRRHRRHQRTASRRARRDRLRHRLKERWGGRWRAHRTDGRSRPSAGRLLNHTVEPLRRDTGIFPQITLRSCRSSDRSMPGLHDRLRTRFLRRRTRGQRNRRRRPGDRHARHRLRAAALRQLTVYTDRSRLASCRKKRAR